MNKGIFIYRFIGLLLILVSIVASCQKETNKTIQSQNSQKTQIPINCNLEVIYTMMTEISD